MLRRTLLAGGLAALALGGCARVPRVPLSADTSLTLDEAFAGQSRGRGEFVVPITGYRRGFDVDLNGTLSSDTLTVVEDFYWDDGEVQQLTWRFTRTAPGRWSGMREDVVGEADVRETENGITLDYTADIEANGEVTRLSFSDILYRRADGAIINEALVRMFGLPVGNVRLVIERQ
ncbi:DUF3833 family protein [Pelagibacterium lentulum]|uniref:Lipoprotein n=1 Tax=Pelagibacterium lentulum TaxID=2029865 RepID=A0A916VWL5_9HYPH|nr:DUF3833 family protein [Pelagibacterium lentulum]GGA47108.1 hypothetical protein GCM10011499_16110 [Pelagibacterium lentulum]